MSADNWAMCPCCLNILKDSRIEFIKKYYGEIPPDLFIKIKEEFDRKINHLHCANEQEFEANKELRNTLLDFKDPLFVVVNDEKQDIDDLINDVDSGCTLREDYEQGVGEDEIAYVKYHAVCEDCGSEWSFNKNDIKQGE